jgi:hypothetical protein
MALKDIIVRSTKGDLEDFKKSIIWLDIKRELNAWKRGFERERDAIVDDASTSNPSTASVLLHLGDINGRIKAVKYMLSIPDVFIQILESESKIDEVNNNEGEI